MLPTRRREVLEGTGAPKNPRLPLQGALAQGGGKAERMPLPEELILVCWMVVVEAEVEDEDVAAAASLEYVCGPDHVSLKQGQMDEVAFSIASETQQTCMHVKNNSNNRSIKKK